MKEIIKQNIQGKKVLFFFALATVVYIFMLAVTIPKVMSYSGGMKLPDMLPTGYSPEYINALLNQLGVEGRNAYLFQQIPVDMVYPLLFAISWSLVLAWFLKKLNKQNTQVIYLCLLPVLGGLFDYLENIGMIIILSTWPANTDTLSQFTNVFTILKSFFSTLFFISLIIVLFIFAYRSLMSKTATK